MIMISGRTIFLLDIILEQGSRNRTRGKNMDQTMFRIIILDREAAAMVVVQRYWMGWEAWRKKEAALAI